MDNRINIIKNSIPLIDLRAPIEFTKGAFPSSVNIPILNDNQRAQVGVKYKNQGNNAAEKLGFKDSENSIFINQNNYQKKFEEYLETPDDPRWEDIAKSGTEHVMKNLTNDNAVDSLLSLIRKITM